MKSPMITNANYIPDKGNYSDLQVLQSPAGWYIGTMFRGFDEEFQEVVHQPGSRDSEYFATKEEAEVRLRYMEETGNTESLRSHP